MGLNIVHLVEAACFYVYHINYRLSSGRIQSHVSSLPSAQLTLNDQIANYLSPLWIVVLVIE